MSKWGMFFFAIGIYLLLRSGMNFADGEYFFAALCFAGGAYELRAGLGEISRGKGGQGVRP